MKTRSFPVLLACSLSTFALTSCYGTFKPKEVVIPANEVIRFDGTNYIVPPARMLEIEDALSQTNLNLK